MTQLDLNNLRKRVEESLNDTDEGFVFCDVEQDAVRTHDRDRLVQFLATRFHVRVAEEDLHEMPRATAFNVAKRVIHGIASGVHAPPDHSDLAHQFIHSFAYDARFYSTYAYKPNQSEGFSLRGKTLIGATLEEGILVCDKDSVGILWAGDCD